MKLYILLPNQTEPSPEMKFFYIYFLIQKEASPYIFWKEMVVKNTIKLNRSTRPDYKKIHTCSIHQQGGELFYTYPKRNWNKIKGNTDIIRSLWTMTIMTKIALFYYQFPFLFYVNKILSHGHATQINTKRQFYQRSISLHIN